MAGAKLQSSGGHRTIASSSQPLNTADQLRHSIAEHRMTASSSQPLGPTDQLLQSTGEHRTTASSSQQLDTADQLLQSAGKRRTGASSSQPLGAARYPNLFDSPVPALSDALLWSQANAKHTPVVSWLQARSRWASAVSANEKQERVWAESRSKRQKLRKDHDIPSTREVESNDNIDAAL